MFYSSLGWHLKKIKCHLNCSPLRYSTLAVCFHKYEKKLQNERSSRETCSLFRKVVVFVCQPASPFAWQMTCGVFLCRKRKEKAFLFSPFKFNGVCAQVDTCVWGPGQNKNNRGRWEITGGKNGPQMSRCLWLVTLQRAIAHLHLPWLGGAWS